MTDACTPHNIGGRLVGMLESTGIEIQKGTVEILDISGQAQYHQTANRAGNDLDRQTAGPLEKQTKKYWQHLDDNLAGGGIQLMGRVLTDQRNPSGILGENVVDPVSEFITNHYRTTYSKATDAEAMKAARSEYKKGIKAVFDGISTDGMSESQKGYFRDYRRFYETQGGELYAQNQTTGAGKAIGNVVSNQIQNSLNVALGNPLEIAIKLPALYDVNVIPGTIEWLKRGAFVRKLPELEEAGLYGFERPEDAPKSLMGKINSKWEGLIGLTDVPTKNLTYLTGAAKGGEAAGIKAVQDVLFNMRLGDLPRQRWSSAGRNETRLVSYTVNSIKLHGGLWSSVVRPGASALERAKAAKALTIMYGATGLIGGLGAVVPQPIEQAITNAYPDTKDWFEENKTPFAELIQTGGVGRLGVAYDIGARKFQKASHYFKSAGDSLSEGDWGGFVTDSGLGIVIAGLSFTKSPLGDAQVQKLLMLGRDIAKDDLDGDIGEELTKDFLPSFAKAK